VIRRAVKQSFYRAVYLAGKHAHDSGVTIFSYHSIDDYGTPLSVSLALFRAQMEALAEEGCVALTMAQVSDHLRARARFPPRAVAITFDDGFQNLITEAAPIMVDYGFVGTVYVITGMVGRMTRWTDRGVTLPSLPLLTWPQIAALHAQGFEIGAHSVTHGFLTQYPPDSLRQELCESRQVLEQKLGTPVTAFAYPQGDYSRRVVAAVRDAGYTTATTVDQGRALLHSDPLRLPRFLISGNTTPLVMRAFTVPAIGPAYKLVNFVVKRLLGRKRWPRRAPGDVDSTGSEPVGLLDG
jgi:peptidoglycan/xylan/chitin deacetylase (PgdA/CDA1 family)